MIPEDIKGAARAVVTPFLTAHGKVDGMALDYAIAGAILAERKRCIGLVYGYAGSDNVAERTAAAIRKGES